MSRTRGARDFRRWFGSRYLALAALAVPLGFWLWALERFHRRFVYDEPQGRVWGISDDVYISACFGRSLISGDGFVWYPGAPRVEGISNPLWSALIGVLHALPFFTEDRLGLFIIGLNGLLLCAVVLTFAAAAIAATEDRSKPSGVPTWTSIGAMLLLPASAALPYWSAEGFEVALLALVTLGGLFYARQCRTRANGIVLGLLLLAGFATRMDFFLLAMPVVFLAVAHHREHRGPLVMSAVVVGLGIGLLLAARYAYYGELLPNTYYLKTTGWSLTARLPHGLEQNRRLLMLAPAAWIPILFPSVRRSLGTALPSVLAGWFGFSATIAYSTYVGGDVWRLFAGYDRHTVVGGVLLAWGNTVLFASARSWAARLGLGLWGVLLGAAAVLAQDGATQLEDGLLAESSPVRNFELDWIRYGKQFRKISEPGARMALCPAGAIVYFSHRGGVDLLGKVEPLVAHLESTPYRDGRASCWRNAPGHNKGDDALVFEARKPEFTRPRPPAAHKEEYFKLKYEGMIFYVRRGTSLVRKSVLPAL